MSDKHNTANDEDQLATIPADYRALLATTCPLIVDEHTMPAWRGGEVCRANFGILLETEDWPAESALRRGEILPSDNSEFGTTANQGPAMGIEEAVRGTAPQVEHAAGSLVFPGLQTDSKLQIRIYIGMS